jgi:hypothetical protein
MIANSNALAKIEISNDIPQPIHSRFDQLTANPLLPFHDKPEDSDHEEADNLAN